MRSPARPRPSASGARRSSTPRARPRRPTRLADAADMIGRNPTTLQLRYLQTLREIGATQNSTIVFPMPIDLIKPVLDAMRPSEAATPAAEVPAPQSTENGALEPGESRALGPGAAASPAQPKPAEDTARPTGRRRRGRPSSARGCGVPRGTRVRRAPPRETPPKERGAAGGTCSRRNLVSLQLQRHRGADLLGVGDLERHREALGLVLLDARLKRLLSVRIGPPRLTVTLAAAFFSVITSLPPLSATVFALRP